MMFKKSNLKIGTKIIIQVLLVLMAILIAMFIYIIFSTRNNDMQDADVEVKAIAEKNASIISSTLELPLNTAETLANSMQGFEGMKAEDRREYYNNMMQSVLQQNSSILGIWTCWEPNALDGMDADFANKAGSDATGRFVSYWVWTDGKVELTACADYETEGIGDYYLLARNSGKETILEPFEYEINGNKVLMTTIAIPIKDTAGTTVGVAGIDLALSDLQNIAFNKGQYNSAYVFVASNLGNIIIHPDASYVGKNMKDIPGLSSDVQTESVKSGSEYSENQTDSKTNQEVKMLFTPIQIGDTSTPWSTGLVINMNEILASSNQTTLTLILILIGVLIAIAFALRLTIQKSVSNPLNATAGFAKSLAEGHLDEKIKIHSMDEIGQLTSILDKQVRQAFQNNVQAQVLAKKRGDYQKEQVDKLVLNLEKLSSGNLDCDTSVTEADADTQELHNVYTGINASFIASIEAIKTLAADANTLSAAAIEGKLSARADTEKHKGDFKKIMEGVNNTLDAVIHPVNETAAVLGEMSKGNLNINVTGNYQGDHAILKNALNDTINTIKGYIFEIAQILLKIAGGDLTGNITSEYKGDFIELKNSINHIVASLNDVMSEINTAADQVASGSGQVSAGNQAISQGATEQASSIEELTASITQIARQIELNAENSNKSNGMALEMKTAAIEGNEQMKNMLLSMDEINESSEKISRIIKVIDDIAFQTNILALNAAVEAARAGVHGKGFAVVAEEVRNLAARSANAAKETTELIEGSIKKVGAGTKIAQVTAVALNKIVESVEQTVLLGDEIAVASAEQASGIAQISQGVEQMSQVVQTNSATAEEGAAASEELSGQAELLKEKISQFKLKNQEIQINDTKKIAAEKTQTIDFGNEKY